MDVKHASAMSAKTAASASALASAPSLNITGTKVYKSSGERGASTIAPKVVKVTTERSSFDKKVVGPAFKLKFGLDDLPLHPCKVEVELSGVPTAYANGLRRVMNEEMRGHRLTVVPPEGQHVASTDFAANDNFIETRIQQIPLRVLISPETVGKVSFGLHVDNATTGVKKVFSGDLVVVSPPGFKEILFNPTFPICELQPGSSVHIPEIRIETGFGNVHATFQTSHRCVTMPLDIPMLPRSETHAVDGKALDLSGYTVSPLLANPRHHRISVWASAVGPDPAEPKTLVPDACTNIVGRLRRLRAGLETPAAAAADSAVTLTLTNLAGGKVEGVLSIPGETATIGFIVARTAYEIEPDIAFTSTTEIHHEKRIQIKLVTQTDAKALLLRAVDAAIGAFESIKSQL